MDHHGYVIVCYVVGSFVALSFAIYAWTYAWWWSNRRNLNKDTGE
jgi:hypothetical protein